jgi:hypothetical protein
MYQTVHRRSAGQTADSVGVGGAGVVGEQRCRVDGQIGGGLAMMVPVPNRVAAFSRPNQRNREAAVGDESRGAKCGDFFDRRRRRVVAIALGFSALVGVASRVMPARRAGVNR